MERYFLIPILLILLSNCQSIDLREAITEFRDKPSNIDSTQDNETYYKTYGTIWEYMRDNSTYVDYEMICVSYFKRFILFYLLHTCTYVRTFLKLRTH